MARSVSVKLKVHRASRRLYKSVGRSLGRTGVPKPRVFYFDPASPDLAVQRVAELKAEWKKLEAAGGRVWEESRWYQREYMGLSEARPCQRETSILTVADGAEAYLADIRRQWEGGQVSEQHFTSQRERLYRAIGLIRHLPLSAIDRQRLDETVLWLCNRPPTNFTGREQRQISATYARAAICTLRWCFDWLAEEELWPRCRQWGRLWKKQVVLTHDERTRQFDGTGMDALFFTLDELGRLWAHAQSDLLRALILLGLNCAFANAECRSLLVVEVKGLGSSEVFIERFRRKIVKRAGSASYAKWHLWPETVKHMLAAKAPSNPEGLWFLTADGRPLDANDSIIQSWRRLLRRADTRPLGFRFLRKSSAHYVRNVLGCGREVTDMQLSHSDAPMIRHYAGRDWDGALRAATERLRRFSCPGSTIPRSGSRRVVQLR